MNTATLSPDDEVFNEQQAAAFLKIPVQSLQKDRIQLQRIPFCKIGKRVLYRRASLMALLAGNEVGGPAVQRSAVAS